MTSHPPPLDRSPSPPPSDGDDASPFHISEELVQSPVHKAAGASSVDELSALLTHPLRLHEDLKEGCGGQLWPAGIVLARYLLQQSFDKDSSFLELGAGGGLVGLAIALQHQLPVHITDQVPMLELMQTNIRLNNLQDHVSASVYDWGTPVPAALSKPDIILAADCVYFEPAFPLLLQTMQNLITERTTCYFCFKKRRRADLHFVKNARKIFHIEDVAAAGREDYTRQNIFLYRITKKAN